MADLAVLARHAGRCALCRGHIERGDLIVRVRWGRGWAHEACAEQEAPADEGEEQ